MQQNCLTMAKTASVLVIIALLALITEGRDWRFKAVKRIKRGYNNGFGANSDTYRGSDEQNASASKERLGCSEEQGGGSYGSGSREIAYNRDGASNDRRRNRSFSKSTASATASATAFNQHQNKNI